MTKTRHPILHGLLLLAPLLLLRQPASCQNAVALKARLHQADDLSALDQPGTKPWHLALTYTLFGDDAKPAQTGTIEEWWSSPVLHKIVTTSPSGTLTEITNADGSFRSASPPIVSIYADLFRHQVVHPLTPPTEIDEADLLLEKKQSGTNTFDCIMLARRIKTFGVAIPLFLFPLSASIRTRPGCASRPIPVRRR